MAQVIRNFPDLPSHQQTVSLDGETYVLEFVWHERLLGWYVSVETADGEAIAQSRRLVGESILLRYVSNPAAPPGILLVRGPQHYKREALGRVLVLVYYSADEVAEIGPDDELEVV